MLEIWNLSRRTMILLTGTDNKLIKFSEYYEKLEALLLFASLFSQTLQTFSSRGHILLLYAIITSSFRRRKKVIYFKRLR